MVLITCPYLGYTTLDCTHMHLYEYIYNKLVMLTCSCACQKKKKKHELYYSVCIYYSVNHKLFLSVK